MCNLLCFVGWYTVISIMDLFLYFQHVIYCHGQQGCLRLHWHSTSFLSSGLAVSFRNKRTISKVTNPIEQTAIKQAQKRQAYVRAKVNMCDMLPQQPICCCPYPGDHRDVKFSRINVCHGLQQLLVASPSLVCRPSCLLFYHSISRFIEQHIRYERFLSATDCKPFFSAVKACLKMKIPGSHNPCNVGALLCLSKSEYI